MGCLDCTRIAICRPGGENANQRSVYSGHKRIHCLMYQTITTPDGLIYSLYGPEVGRRHDLTLYTDSGWDDKLKQYLVIDGIQYYIYSDAAFVRTPYLLISFKTEFCTGHESMFNFIMSGLRVSVEWNYKDLKQLWCRNDFPRMLKVRQLPVGMLYKASALLMNMRTCLYRGGGVARYFSCPKPSLQ